MSNAVRFTQKKAIQRFQAYALVLVAFSTAALAGCSGLVTANNGGGGTPPPLTISGVHAAAPTTSGFQVSWSTNVAANSTVDFGTTANYGSSTPTNSAMVTSHQVALSGLAAGTLYHFRVRSTDVKNSSASGPDTTFSTAANTTPPTVSVTSPAANATLSGVVTISASATANGGAAVTNVQFKVDNANTGAAITAAPYNYSLNTNALSNGNHTLTAAATDTAGITATSPGIAVKVSNTVTAVPSITSLNPVSGLVGTSVTIVGANFGATQVTSTVTFNGTAATAASWSAASITATVPSGATTGNVVVTVGGVASNGVGFTVQTSTTPPSVPTGLTALAVSSSQINLSWTASTGSVTGYNIFRGGTKVGTSLTSAYQDVGLTASTSYTYTVSAYDAAGNTSAQSAGASATTQAVSSGGGLPSSLGWYQIPNTKLAPVCPPGAGTACGAVISAWSGGIADTSRNQLLVWGGGHTDYTGNEVYALDLNSLTMNRITNPSVWIGSCAAADADGNPNSRHTYNGLAYIANSDRMFAYAGSLACGSGGSAWDTWTFSLANRTWQRMDPVNGTNVPGNAGFGDVSDYDPNTGLVYVGDNSNLFSYNYATNTYTKLGGLNPNDYHLTGVIDPKRRLFITVGNGNALKGDIDPTHTYSSSSLAMTGCGPILTALYPGLAYDAVQDRIVGWAGGDTVYLYNPSSDSCTSVTYPNGPGAAQSNGSFGRFRYFPNLGVFAVVNDWQQNAYALRLTSGGGTGSGPVITGISVSGITTTNASVSWTTNVAATTQVEYGPTTVYGTLTTLNSTLSTSHSQALAGLTLGTLYHYRVRSKNSSGVESISGDFAFQTSSTVNTTPPTVSIAAPANGANVSGTTTVSANATAAGGASVASVQFTLDGSNLGSALTASPYQTAWDTTTAANGSHLLSAVAWDTSNNSATAIAVTVSVSNPTGGGGAAQQDFNARCTAPGVVYCMGFDDATGFQQNVNIFENSSYPGVFPKQDSTTGRSGTSLRIDIPPFQGANSGRFATAFPGIGGSNSDFYFQVATRISPEMLSNFANTQYGWSTWKNHGFFSGNTSCTGQMVVTGLSSDGVIPIATTGGCSSHAFFTNNGIPPYLLQQGYYNCPYRGETPILCFYWPTNKWITFYYHLHLGVLDSQGNYPNTVAEAWVAVDGQPYKKWIDIPSYYYTGDGPGRVFDHLELYPYMTGKDASIGGYPTGHVWFDELIISTQPIAAPAVPPALP
jgi:hypothetical protein